MNLRPFSRVPIAWFIFHICARIHSQEFWNDAGDASMISLGSSSIIMENYFAKKNIFVYFANYYKKGGILLSFVNCKSFYQ